MKGRRGEREKGRKGEKAEYVIKHKKAEFLPPFYFVLKTVFIGFRVHSP